MTDTSSQVRAAYERGLNDAALLDTALEALLARERAAELDSSYKAYDAIALGSRDECDLAVRRATRPVGESRSSTQAGTVAA